MTQQPLVAGIDIGGTNVVFGLVTSDGRIIQKAKLKTKQYADINVLVQDIADQINRWLVDHAEYTLIGCGAGAPNGNFYTGNIEYAPNLTWKGIVPLGTLLERALKVKSVITNDANAAALGEMIFGAAKGMKHIIMITLGTGLGSGIVVDGKLVYGYDGFAGELGHVIIKPGGRLCGCGRRGCLETYCSATGLVTTYKEISGTTSDVTAKEIYDRALQHENSALKAIEITGETLGLALANAAPITSPQAFILFGGLTQAGELLLKFVRAGFNNSLYPLYQNKIQLLLSQLNEKDGAILGAASLIWNTHA
jgi:glucokinase